MIDIVMLIAPIVAPVFLILFYLLFRYKIIKYINEDSRIVLNRFTRVKYEQALDHYGWFNMNRIKNYRDFDYYNEEYANTSIIMPQKFKIKPKIQSNILNYNTESKFVSNSSKGMFSQMYPEKNYCKIGHSLFPPWYIYRENEGRFI